MKTNKANHIINEKWRREIHVFLSLSDFYMEGDMDGQNTWILDGSYFL
ncbi:hypothetical protein [Neobacillus sp. KR4-4]